MHLRNLVETKESVQNKKKQENTGIQEFITDTLEGK